MEACSSFLEIPCFPHFYFEIREICPIRGAAKNHRRRFFADDSFIASATATGRLTPPLPPSL
jgi:hypothetical protein